MTVSASTLNPGTTLGSSDQVVVTAGTGTTVVTQALISNPSSAASSVTIKLLREGATSSVTIVPGRAIGVSGTDILPELAGLVLNAGDVLSASGLGVVLVMSGYVVS